MPSAKIDPGNMVGTPTTGIYWRDKRIWKDCFTSTVICLLGCSIGGMGIAFLLVGYKWLYVLSLSLIAGFISCMAFMIVWNMMFRKMSLRDAFIHSYKMSIVSIFIMILTENAVIFLAMPTMLDEDMMSHGRHGWIVMMLAMSLGFILSLPYNYYQLHRSGKICH